MFSGLVREIGIVRHLGEKSIIIQSSLNPKIGASIAVNGVCLTATRVGNGEFEALLSDESQSVIAMENLSGKVHLEEALALGDRLDGHIVQGHIDCVGVIERIVKHKNGYDFFISFEAKNRALFVPKGSVCVDGISLTINEVLDSTFRLTIIPHTFENTLFCTYKPQRRVNIETDIITRSVLHILQTMQNGEKNTESNSKEWQKIEQILASY